MHVWPQQAERSRALLQTQGAPQFARVVPHSRETGRFAVDFEHAQHGCAPTFGHQLVGQADDLIRPAGRRTAPEANKRGPTPEKVYQSHFPAIWRRQLDVLHRLANIDPVHLVLLRLRGRHLAVNE